MTTYKKSSCTNERLNELFETIPNFKLQIFRYSETDGRLGCGLGYTVKLTNNDKTYNFLYNSSRAEGQREPNPIDVLECTLSDSYADTTSFENFCDEFGYDRFVESSKTGIQVINLEAKKAFEGCKRAYDKLHELFTDEELEKIEEIVEESR